MSSFSYPISNGKFNCRPLHIGHRILFYSMTESNYSCWIKQQGNSLSVIRFFKPRFKKKTIKKWKTGSDNPTAKRGKYAYHLYEFTSFQDQFHALLPLYINIEPCKYNNDIARLHASMSITHNCKTPSATFSIRHSYSYAVAGWAKKPDRVPHLPFKLGKTVKKKFPQ